MEGAIPIRPILLRRLRIADIKILPSFFIIIGILFLIDQQGIFLTVAICAGLHELGHLLAIWIVRIPIARIRISATGAEIQLQESTKSMVSNAFIMAAGPIFSLLTAILFAYQNQPMYAGISFVLGAFNSLPILPLDGGQFLQIILENRFSNLRLIISWGGAIFIGILGSILLLQSKGNFSLLMIGLFLISRQFHESSCKFIKKEV